MYTETRDPYEDSFDVIDAQAREEPQAEALVTDVQRIAASDQPTFAPESKAIIEALPDGDFEGLRLRRMSGPERAAAAKREQAELFTRMVQGLKLTSSSVGPIDFQVLFPLLFIT